MAPPVQGTADTASTQIPSDIESMLASALLKFRSQSQESDGLPSSENIYSTGVPNPLRSSSNEREPNAAKCERAAMGRRLIQPPTSLASAANGILTSQLQSALMTLQQYNSGSTHASPGYNTYRPNCIRGVHDPQSQLLSIQAPYLSSGVSAVPASLGQSVFKPIPQSVASNSTIFVSKNTSLPSNHQGSRSLNSTSKPKSFVQSRPRAIQHEDLPNLLRDTAKNSSTAAVVSASQALVRTHEIAAALRSKPQRGRKRDDLTEIERLELTRTRNREHAKSTRVRKKTRLDQLMENEQRLLSLKTQEQLMLDRRQHVVDFVALRARMLRSRVASLPSDSSSTQSDDTRPTENTSSIPMSFSDLQLSDMVLDMSVFTFRDGNHQESLATSDEVSITGRTRDSMNCFDESLVAQFVNAIGDEATSQILDYEITGGVDQVSLNPNNAGLVLVHLVRKPRDTSHRTSSRLRTGLLQVQFAPDSAKLSAVGWSWLPHRTGVSLGESSREGRDPDPEDGASHEPRQQRLRGQVSHPSVVSLDPTMTLLHHHSGDSSRGGVGDEPSGHGAPRSGLETFSLTDDEGQAGPGMNI